jgi:sugar phosphate isomerase/epimerase
MRFGISTSLTNAPLLKSLGYHYIEENAQTLLRAHDQTADHWRGSDLALSADLPIPAVNGMLPADHKLTGPDVDTRRNARYATILFSRAQRVGIKTIVFGSGGARSYPDGFDRATARSQIISFLKSIAPLAYDHDITLVIEHLNKKESNILNTPKEAAEYVREINHPAVKLLLDTYHLWEDNLSLDEVRETADLVHHVHVADKQGRVAPGISGQSDYRPVFQLLKQSGYGAPGKPNKITIEASINLPTDAPKALAHLQSAWASA